MNTADGGWLFITLVGDTDTAEIKKVAPNGATETIKMSKSIDNAGSCVVETSVVENTVNNETFATQEIPLFCDSEGKGVIYKGRNNLLFAPPGTGKNRLAYSIAQSKQIKRPLFFLLEDPHGHAKRQCEDAVGEKVEIVTTTMWKKSVEDEKNAGDWEADNKTLFDRKYPEYRNLKQIPKLIGISDPKKLGPVDLFNKLLEEKLDNEVDFVCLDNLKMLLGSVSNITTQLVDDLISLPSRNHITFLVLHHTKKESLEIAGAAALEEIFDNIYRLTQLETDESQLLLEETKARDAKKQAVKITRTFEQGRVHHKIQSVEDYLPQQKKKPPNLHDKIVAFLSDYDKPEITIQELHGIFGGTEKGIKNELPHIGSISMSGGGTLTISMAGSKNGKKTWDVIAINKST